MKNIAMDDIFWNDGWVETEDSVMSETLSRLTTTNTNWVTDGVFFKRRGGLWSKATDFIWLDFPLVVTFYRIFIRTIRRIWSRELLFGTKDCTENAWTVFTNFNSKSILWWCLSQHYPLRKKLMKAIKEEVVNERGLTVRKFRSPNQTEDWFKIGVEEALSKAVV